LASCKKESRAAGIRENGQATRLLSSNSLRPIRQPVVAAVQGAMAAGCGITTACGHYSGFGVAAVCHLQGKHRLCFCDGNFAALGLEKTAFELVVTGETVSAARANELGFGA
jgi:enoyl-CoA hydratase/carnithine racemase